MAGGGPFADVGGVSFEEVADEAIEDFAGGHAGFDEFVYFVACSALLLAGVALVFLGAFKFYDALFQFVLEIVGEALLDEEVVEGEVGGGFDEGAGAGGEVTFLLNEFEPQKQGKTGFNSCL